MLSKLKSSSGTPLNSLSMDSIWKCVNNLQGELSKADKKHKDLNFKKQELATLLERSSSRVERLKSKLLQLKKEEAEWKQKERTFCEDIQNLTAIIDKRKAELTMDDENGEEQEIDKEVSSFEKDSRDIVNRMKLLLPNGQDLQKGSEEKVKQLREEVRVLEAEVKRYEEMRERSLPVEEIKILLNLVNKKHGISQVL